MQFVRQLLAKGNIVHATARKPEQATSLKELSKNGGSLTIAALDVGSPSSISSWASELKGKQPFDVRASSLCILLFHCSICQLQLENPLFLVSLADCMFPAVPLQRCWSARQVPRRAGGHRKREDATQLPSQHHRPPAGRATAACKRAVDARICGSQRDLEGTFSKECHTQSEAELHKGKWKEET